MRQVSVNISATHSRFTMQQGGVEVDLGFFSPIEPGDLRRQGVPLSYLTATARSIDGANHRVSLYFDISGEWTDNDTGTQIVWDQQAFTESVSR